MQLEFHQVDAFSSRPFSGNPAVVYRLDAWLADELMQMIATEHNLSETAFVVREGEAWRIRWFTPSVEVALCGHATLAAAHVLFEVYDEPGERLEFISRSGALRVNREDERLVWISPRSIRARSVAPSSWSRPWACRRWTCWAPPTSCWCCSSPKRRCAPVAPTSRPWRGCPGVE